VGLQTPNSRFPLHSGWSGNTCLPYWKGLGSVTRFWHGFICSIRPYKHVFKLINLIPNFSPCHVGHVRCPLSPLLFAAAIEPLSIALKSSLLLRGVGRGTEEHRVSLYADNLLIYVSNSETSAPIIVSLLNIFRSFSGYKLNYQKSECLPINDLAMQIKQESVPCHLTHSGFKYLGINITRSFTSLLGAKKLTK